MQITMETAGETLEEQVSRVVSGTDGPEAWSSMPSSTCCASTLGILSGSKLLQVLDFMNDQLEAGLGHGSDLAAAFRERRDGLRTMLIEGAIDDLAEPAH